MVTLIRTDANNIDFRGLVTSLDQELHLRDGEEHGFYSQFNKIDSIKYSVVAYQNAVVAGIGALRPYKAQTVEIKRMFVSPQFRRQGIGKLILMELEKWAKELHFTTCILETGWKQPEAIGLYKLAGYQNIPNYGQYINIENSVCMSKLIIST